MRKILFRGKRIDNGEWIEGQTIVVIHQDDNDLIFMPQHGEDVKADIMDGNDRTLTSIYGNYYQILPETVEQFTGLTDKNGKKIFEGDIVDITQYDNVYHKVHRCCKSKVFFSNFAFRTNAAPDYEDEEPLSYWFWNDCDFEVIGNIYDNPELLEVSE